MKFRLCGCIASLLTVALLSSTFAQNQPSVPTDAEVAQIRQSIAAAMREQPPPMYAEQHQKDTNALREKLRKALQAQRQSMATYLEHIRTLFPDRVAQIESDIRNKDREIDTLPPAITAQGGPAPKSSPSTNNGPNAVTTDGDNTSTASSNNTSTTNGSGTGGLPALTPQGLPPAMPLTGAQISALLAEISAIKKGTELGPCALAGPNSGLSEYESAVCQIANDVRSRKANSPGATVAINFYFQELQEIIAAKLIGKSERGKFLLDAEEQRTDKQTGGGPSNTGTTSLVVKGGAPAILGFAVENGGLTRTADGTTVTFRGNPIGLYKALRDKTFEETYLSGANDWATKALKKASFALSFDTSRGPTPGVLTGDRNQLSSYALRYEFKNDRDPRNPKHDEAFEKFLAQFGNDLALSIAGAYNALVEDVGGAGSTPLKGNKFKDPVLQSWLEETSKAVASASAVDVEATWKAQLDKFPALDKFEASTRNTVENFADHFSSYLDARKKLLADIAKGSVITAEFTQTRNVNSPNFSNFRFIAETGIFGGKADLTGNASFTIFNSLPAGITSRVRDFQFAGQLDAPIKVGTIGSFVFSFAGKYERALGNVTALDGTVLPNTKGDIAVGQVKLTIPVKKGSGVSFPISVSFANRTELLREKEVRGHIGFTFDLDKIMAKFKPF